MGNVTRLPPFRTVNWFSLLWLVYIVYPIVAFYGQPRPAWLLVVVTLAFLAFIAVYVRAFNVRDGDETDAPLNPAAVTGTVMSFVLLGTLWPVIGANAGGLVVYAASFAGFQRSRWPLLACLVVNVAVIAGLYLEGELPSVAFAWMLVFSVAVGLGNNYFYRWNVASRHLRQAQAEVVRIAKVAERERIARDLHDLLGHTLSVIALKSELAARLAERDPARAAKEIRDVERISREALAEVRSAVRGYRAEGGLAAELASASLALEAAGVRLEHSSQPLDLDVAQEGALALALREAVTNVVRHAGATVCRIALERTGDSARLTVADDGRGCAGSLEGAGLAGMRERVAALGGRLTLESGAGTRLTVTLPLQAPEKRPASLAGRLEAGA